MGIIEGLVNAISHARDEQLKRTEKPAPEIPDNLSATAKKLAEMFMEHVPTSILDSGSAYGYAYQRARENPVWEEPYSYPEFRVINGKDSKLDVLIYISTFHLLGQQLEYDAEADKKFQEWRLQLDKEGKDWEEHLEEFINPEDNTPCTNTNEGYFGRTWCISYTYNEDTLLNRNFIYWKYHNLVIISIHNGCDARGGFTEPVLFKQSGYGDFNPYEFAEIVCPECEAYWTYETYYFYESSDDNKSLDKDYPCEKGESGKVGTVVVTEDHKAFCPVCGKGILK